MAGLQESEAPGKAAFEQVQVRKDLRSVDRFVTGHRMRSQ